MKNNRKAKLAALALIPTLGVMALAGSAFAADGTSTATTPTTASSSRHFMGMGHRFHGHRDNTTFAANLASVLGLSATDVKARLDAGQTPSSIITAAGKNPADVMAALKVLGQASMKAKLAAAVSSGKITQTQADARLAHEANETQGGHRGGIFRGMMETTSSTTNSTQ